MSTIGTRVPRKQSPNKVTGRARYADDVTIPGTFHGVIVPSRQAHAKIIRIDTETARRITGVKAILTGDDLSVLTDDVTEDRPPFAKEKFGIGGNRWR